MLSVVVTGGGSVVGADVVGFGVVSTLFFVVISVSLLFVFNNSGRFCNI